MKKNRCCNKYQWKDIKKAANNRLEISLTNYKANITYFS